MRLESIVVTDCGSTTTKGIWFSCRSGRWKVEARAEAPTTVEKPVADVTIGVMNALKALGNEREIAFISENQHDWNLLLGSSLENPQMYLSTSSAGGGLQMICLGIVGSISAKSSERAALGAGAIVQSVLSLDSDYEFYEAAQLIRELRPDIILFSGGTDGGAKEQLEDLAEILLLAEPRSRFETDSKVPVVFAGNAQAAADIQKLLDPVFSVKVVENIRAEVNSENLTPARNAVHDIFLDHVMSQAPGYKKLQGLVSKPIIPTPVAVSKMIEKASTVLGKSILAVDIGGATTDIFSIRKSVTQDSFLPVHRSVSANLGMSYSIGNVIETAGPDKIQRWLPYSIQNGDLANTLWNKMIRPTTLPESLKDLFIEQAAAREALSLSLKHHIELDSNEDLAKKTKDIADIFNTSKTNQFSMFDIDLIIGSGGVLSHAPDRASAGLMLLDSFRPLGLTFLGIDSIFMLPHLGVISETDADAAMELLFSECIVPLGTVLTPTLKHSKVKIGEVLFSVSISESEDVIDVCYGELKVVPVESKKEVTIKVHPKKKGLCFGIDDNLSCIMEGGHMGLIFDGRCDHQDRLLEQHNSVELTQKWLKSLNIQF